MTEKRPTYRTRRAAPPITAKLPARARVSEHDEQTNFVALVRQMYGARDDFFPPLFFSVPNGMWAGGQNPYALVSKFKAEGFRPGVADILYLQPRGDYSYLAIEMKAEDKRKSKGAVSPEQTEFLESVNAAGGWGEVCYGADEALRVFTTYMSMEAR